MKIGSKDSVQIVAINYENRKDLDYAKGDSGNIGFYKFPVNGQYPKTKCEYIAFYLSDDDYFGKDRRGITFYAEIIDYKIMKRKNICKTKEFLERNLADNDKDYFKLEIGKLTHLKRKIGNDNKYGLRYRYTSLSKLSYSNDISEL